MMNLRIVYGFQDVPDITPFDLWPLDFVKSNIHGLHSLQQKDCQKSIKYGIFGDSSHMRDQDRSIWCQDWREHQAQ